MPRIRERLFDRLGDPASWAGAPPENVVAIIQQKVGDLLLDVLNIELPNPPNLH